MEGRPLSGADWGPSALREPGPRVQDGGSAVWAEMKLVSELEEGCVAGPAAPAAAAGSGSAGRGRSREARCFAPAQGSVSSPRTCSWQPDPPFALQALHCGQ